MTSKSLVCFRKGLAVSLMAAVAVVSAQPGYAVPGRVEQANGGQSSNNPPDVKAMVERAEKLRAEKQFGEAAAIWNEILVNVKKVLGPDHADVATSLDKLAELLRKQGKYAAAEPLYRRSLAIREKTLGSDHPAFAASINNLAGLLKDQGQYSAAEPLYRRSLAIYEKALGPDHLNIAASINNLAVLLMHQGQYAAAEPLYRRSLAIYEKALGSDHSNIATSLNNLAELLRKQGQYAAAEPLIRRSLVIREKAFGPEHPAVAVSLNSLAGLLEDQGQYAAADPLYRRSLAIREKALGPDHPDVAESINNLAGLLMTQGKYAAAEPLYRRSGAIREKALGPDHPEVATSFGNLALLLAIQGQYAAAELFMRRSLVIREKALGPEHPAVADSLNKLGWLLMDQGQYAAADPYYRRSLAILKKSLGSGHPDVAHSMESLALLLAVQGQYAGAELHYRRSLAIREKALGPTHPDVVSSLTNLAGVLHEQKRYSDVIPILRRSRRIEAAWLIRELPLLSDQVRTDQLRQLGRGWEFIVQLIEFYPPATQLALETRLNRQGLLSEIEQRQALLLNNPNVDRVKVEQLQALTQQLASVTLMSDRRAEVRKQRDKLQAEIYRQIPELQPQLVTAGEVAKALPADGSLVEFQRYHPFVERKPKDKRWGAAQYIALVLKPDASVASVPLGPAAAIDATIQKGLQASADGLSDADAIWAQLSNQVLKPLLPQLSGSRQWFLSPDGELNRVPFAALPAPQQPGTPLGQAVQLRLLTTGRELVRLQQPTPAGSASLVMANPSYDRLGAKPGQESKAAEVTTVAQQRSAELGSNKWKQLPASEREGQTVAKLLSTGMLSGTSATTKALQRQHGPRVLHVATHGFFVADQETQPTEALRAIQEGSPLLSSLRRENPQLRSGLVLAGANQPELDPSDDGYLTAAEVVTLNLKGTELVVLSACSTGQGEVRSGEGVYGLQRSLTVAGARSTLLSLWKVDDAATAEFMDRYYQRLKAGEGRSDALAAVQQEFHSGKVQSPSGTNWKEPYYWAAWQLVGDWRPIKGL